MNTNKSKLIVEKYDKFHTWFVLLSKSKLYQWEFPALHILMVCWK